MKRVKKSRTRVVVLFGGQSAEHDVSCTTARHVVEAIDRELFDILAVGISRDGIWSVVDDPFALESEHEKPTKMSVVGEVVNPWELLIQERSRSSDLVVLPLLHGPMGEDGTVQGLLELLDIAYVGSGVLGSAVSMDKAVAKRLVGEAGIEVPRWLRVHELENRTADAIAHDIRQSFGFPCFVKPANMGSSVGVSRVASEEELGAALQHALTYDSTVLVEEAINGRELEIAVLGNENPAVFGPGEVIPADVFYSYADKYLDGRSRTAIPADIPQQVAAVTRDLAIRIFRTLGCSGLGRCDFFYEEDTERVLFNEMNTMPGFTPISMYPKLVLSSGVTYAELIERLITLAVERHELARRRTDY